MGYRVDRGNIRWPPDALVSQSMMSPQGVRLAGAEKNSSAVKKPPENISSQGQKQMRFAGADSGRPHYPSPSGQFFPETSPRKGYYQKVQGITDQKSPKQPVTRKILPLGSKDAMTMSGPLLLFRSYISILDTGGKISAATLDELTLRTEKRSTQPGKN
jgi:hypothetical protein